MSEPRTSKINQAWETLFSQRPILHDVDTTGLHRITADEINRIGEHQARLMAKFDHSSQLPKIFKDNRLAILPTARGGYVIGRFQCYIKIDQDADEEIIQSPLPDKLRELQSIDPSDLYNEPAALLCAYYAGLIEDVLEEELQFSVYGRMGTRAFDFSIQTEINGSIVPHSVDVDRSQCEIDAGFEGPSSFAIVEVKLGQIDDFHIRQLYYPYRLWLGKNRMDKRVVPVFLTYSTEIFTFSVYKFTDAEDFNSIGLVKRKRYQIAETEINISDIRNILAQTQVRPEPPDVPFPQADRFERVIDMLARLRASNGLMTRDEVTETQVFDSRQTNYYIDSGRYLGLIDKDRTKEIGVSYTLTQLGLQIMNQQPRARNLSLIRQLMMHSVFHDALQYYLDNARQPSIPEIQGFIRAANLPINDTTSGRRAQTVIAWIRWVLRLTAGA